MPTLIQGSLQSSDVPDFDDFCGVRGRTMIFFDQRHCCLATRLLRTFVVNFPLTERPTILLDDALLDDLEAFVLPGRKFDSTSVLASSGVTASPSRRTLTAGRRPSRMCSDSLDKHFGATSVSGCAPSIWPQLQHSCFPEVRFSGFRKRQHGHLWPFSSLAEQVSGECVWRVIEDGRDVDGCREEGAIP